MRIHIYLIRVIRVRPAWPGICSLGACHTPSVGSSRCSSTCLTDHPPPASSPSPQPRSESPGFTVSLSSVSDWLYYQQHTSPQGLFVFVLIAPDTLHLPGPVRWLSWWGEWGLPVRCSWTCLYAASGVGRCQVECCQRPRLIHKRPATGSLPVWRPTHYHCLHF